MARVKQFADDLGISKNQAQSLINKGRSRKDGGSQILENVMKPKGYRHGGSKTRRSGIDGPADAAIKELGEYIKPKRRSNVDDFKDAPKFDKRKKDAKKMLSTVKTAIKKKGTGSLQDTPSDNKGYKDGGYKPKKKPNRNYSNDAQSSVVSNKEKLKRIGKDLDRPKDATKGFDMGPDHPYVKALNKAKKESGQEAAEKNKKADGGLPDLTGDGKVTRADVLKGRGVPGFSRGGGMAIQGLGFKGVR